MIRRFVVLVSAAVLALTALAAPTPALAAGPPCSGASCVPSTMAVQVPAIQPCVCPSAVCVYQASPQPDSYSSRPQLA